MSKRILITSTDAMMKQFLEPHVLNLLEHGYEVEIACSNVLDLFRDVQKDLGDRVKIHRLSLQRSPLALSSHVKGYKELSEIISSGRFDLIWTNEPVMGVVTRLAAQKARKKGAKVLYMVHGFHFYRGAPLLNWLVYFPIEKLMASRADCICTINREDFARAQTMRAGTIRYIHGVGINTERLRPSTQQTNIRRELGLPDNSFLVISVGELNKNKNQQLILRAVASLRDPEIHYILCGKGDQKNALESLAKKLGIGDHVHFLGYRNDVVDICSQANVFAMSSKREGLPVASLEAMYCGLPLVNTRTRGLVDVTEDGKSGYVSEINDVEDFAKGICKVKEDPKRRTEMGERNRRVVIPFCIASTKDEVLSLIQDLLEQS